MNEVQLEQKRIDCLIEAIEHWERMRDNPFGRETPYGDDCPLCSELGCERCPVAEDRDEWDGEGCAKFPEYWEARGAWEMLVWDSPSKDFNYWRTKANAVIAELERLLKLEEEK